MTLPTATLISALFPNYPLSFKKIQQNTIIVTSEATSKIQNNSLKKSAEEY